MDELLAAAAKATGMSETMVKRSAAARAKAQGTTVEAVLAEWAGVEVPAGGAVAVAAEAAPVAPTAPAAVAPGLEIEESGDEVGGAAPVAAPVASIAPREVVPAGAVPRWLATLFVVVPLFALAYVAFLPNGPSCGDAGRLAVDPVSGEMVNCDGSAIGGNEIDFFALGEEAYSRAGCIACHGPGGAGVANFPAFTGGALLTTFPEGSCATHIEWIRLGTAGWPDPTYGANAKPVGGSGAVMPTFGAILDDRELAAVALFERVSFGGQDPEAAQTDCFGITPETAPEG